MTVLKKVSKGGEVKGEELPGIFIPPPQPHPSQIMCKDVVPTLVSTSQKETSQRCPLQAESENRRELKRKGRGRGWWKLHLLTYDWTSLI